MLRLLFLEHGPEGVLVVQAARYGTTNLGAKIMQRSQASMKSDRVLGGARCAQRVLLGGLLLSLLEASEVVLDQERRVEFANSYVVIT